MLREYTAAVQAMAEAGVLVDCAPLTATSAATTVRVRDGQPLLTDGPAAELREQVGGYAIIDCPDLDDALKWAAAMPAARDCSVEVRAIVDTGERALRPELEELLRRCWWGAVAEVARATGRLDVAEDSVQDACVVAVQQWTAGHVPRDPQAWLTGVARHKALDRLRRESRRPAKEATAAKRRRSDRARRRGGRPGPFGR